MLFRMAVAATALSLAGPAMADDTCLQDARAGVECDVFLDEHPSDEVPVGTADVWGTEEFVLERHQELGAEPATEFPSGKDIVYWDGDSAMIVPEETGPRLEIADW